MYISYNLSRDTWKKKIKRFFKRNYMRIEYAGTFIFIIGGWMWVVIK